MTSQTGKARVDWRRAIVGGVARRRPHDRFRRVDGVRPARPTASDTRAPGEPCTGEDCAKPVAGEPDTRAPGRLPNEDAPKPVAGEAPDELPANMTADQALTIIYNEYDMGDGGGQLSTLIDDVMTLRAQGFKASNANKAAIQDALETPTQPGSAGSRR